MNKALHALVYVFLVLAAAALWFEKQLYDKRSELTDRNRQQEDYLVQLAQTIEKEGPAKGVSAELNKDASSVEARLVDTPDMENVLDGYKSELEQANLDTFNWNNISTRTQLRSIYARTPDGELIMDGEKPYMQGAGTSDELLKKLFEAAKAQRSRLDTTRAELVTLRQKLASAIEEINSLKPEARQDKVTIEEKKEQIAKLEESKSSLENDITKLKAQVDEYSTEVTSLKDEVSTAKDEIEEKKEELAKAQKIIETQRKLMTEMIASRGGESARSGTAVSSLPAGDKGTIILANNEDMFAIVHFTDEAMKEMRNDKNPNSPLPILELGVKRPGFKGEAGEFVGRIRIRQEVKGKNYVICDILGAWEQSKLQPNDVIFAD